MNMDERNAAVQGSSVLLDINHGDRLTFARLNTSSILRIGNVKCSLDPLIGSPYGAVFELQHGSNGPCLVRISPRREEGVEVELGQKEQDSVEVLDDSDKLAGDGIERDNRGLVDNNTAQKLTAEDINQLRRIGASGKEIVEALIANSTTFQSKTSFSQEKYKRKKQKKYAPQLVLRQTCARSVCEAFFLKSPQKIGFLRMDMLALMLSLANVGAHADVLVMDMVGGLVIAAVAERLGGFGSVCSIYHTAKPPPFDILGMFNMSDLTAKRILRASLSEFLAVRDMKAETIAPGHGATVIIKGGMLNEDCIDPSHIPHDKLVLTTGEMEMKEADQSCNDYEAERTKTVGAMHIEGSNEEPKEALSIIEDTTLAAGGEINIKHESNGEQGAFEKDAKRCNRSNKAGKHATTEDVLHWSKHGFTGLIVAAPGLDPWSFLSQLLPFLSPSSPFVIYHPYLQPLADCMYQIQTKRMAISLQISEPWLREYQVLSSRTHPHMQMSSTAGYVLSGIKVVTE